MRKSVLASWSIFLLLGIFTLKVDAAVYTGEQYKKMVKSSGDFFEVREKLNQENAFISLGCGAYKPTFKFEESWWYGRAEQFLAPKNKLPIDSTLNGVWQRTASYKGNKRTTFDEFPLVFWVKDGRWVVPSTSIQSESELVGCEITPKGEPIFLNVVSGSSAGRLDLYKPVFTGQDTIELLNVRTFSSCHSNGCMGLYDSDKDKKAAKSRIKLVYQRIQRESAQSNRSFSPSSFETKPSQAKTNKQDAKNVDHINYSPQDLEKMTILGAIFSTQNIENSLTDKSLPELRKYFSKDFARAIYYDSRTPCKAEICGVDWNIIVAAQDYEDVSFDIAPNYVLIHNFRTVY